jgi:hypothetical protein
MKNLIYAIAICLFVASCEKYDSGPINQDLVSKRLLSDSEILLKSNLDQAAKIMADIIQDDAVLSELSLLSDESRTFYSLPFADLLNETKNAAGSFKNLRERFMSECSSNDSKGGWNDLANFLAKNDCYI